MNQESPGKCHKVTLKLKDVQTTPSEQSRDITAAIWISDDTVHAAASSTPTRAAASDKKHKESDADGSTEP